jgi:predicted DNA-binding protein (UPF0251 family)
MQDRVCLACGIQVSTGIRCRKCNGAHIALQHAIDLQEQDRSLLRMVAAEQLTPGRLAARWGVSRMAADLRIKGARRRQALLAQERIDHGVFN